MSRRYLMMPNLPKEEALFQNVVAAFVEKAIFSEAELVIVWEKEEDIQTYLGRWLYGLPVQAGRFRHLLRTNLQEGQEGQLLSDADAYIIGRHPGELPLIDLAFRKGMPIFGPEDDWFHDLELLPEEQARQDACEKLMQDLLLRFPQKTHELLLVHQGLGESSALFCWLQAYRASAGKKLLLICFQASRGALFSQCPAADVVAMVQPFLYAYLATRRRNGNPWKNFLALHFMPLEGETKDWTLIEKTRQFLGLPGGAELPLVQPKSIAQEAQSAVAAAQELGLPRGRSVMLFTDGFSFSKFYEAHPDFWAALVQELRQRGFAAVVNGETQIPGAKNVFLPIWETVALASWCGHIVSISTGMTELCCTFAPAAHLSMTMVWPNARDPYHCQDAMRWRWRMEMIQDYGMTFMEHMIASMHRYEDRLWKENVDAADVILAVDDAGNRAFAAQIADRIAERSRAWN